MDSVFGVHEQALRLKSVRAEVLANNLVNNSTPGFKARDFDFHAALRQEVSQQATKQPGNTQPNLGYRLPMQETVDGNTVENEVEQMLYAQNALEYKATISFIKHRASNIIQALRGGE